MGKKKTSPHPPGEGGRRACEGAWRAGVSFYNPSEVSAFNAIKILQIQERGEIE